MKIKEDLQSQQQMISISSKMILQSLQAQAIRAIDKIKLTLQSEYQRWVYHIDSIRYKGLDTINGLI